MPSQRCGISGKPVDGSSVSVLHPAISSDHYNTFFKSLLEGKNWGNHTTRVFPLFYFKGIFSPEPPSSILAFMIMKRIIPSILFILACLIPGVLPAQQPNDAIYMKKNSICVLAAYSHSSWDKYWENELKRENFNIGTNTTEAFMVMAAGGISDKLNAIIGLPYIKTHNSAGNLLGQKGLQDLMAALKYKLFDQKGLSLHGTLAGSLPVSNYVPDFLPMSIGLHSPSVSARLIFNYKHTSGLYFTAHGAYTARGKVKTDRDAYQAHDRVFNTNEMAIPNATDGGVQLGYLKHGLQATLLLERFDCVGGDFIRRNDAPYPTNDMEVTNAGAYIKYQPGHFGINARYAYTISGKNAGQSTSLMAGILYQFSIKKSSN